MFCILISLFSRFWRSLRITREALTFRYRYVPLELTVWGDETNTKCFMRQLTKKNSVVIRMMTNSLEGGALKRDYEGCIAFFFFALRRKWKD